MQHMKLFGICTVLWFTSVSFALEKDSTIKACFIEWYPYSYIENKQPKGLSIELYSTVMKRAGIAISFSQRPWQRCLAELKQGKFDAVVDGGITIPNTLNAKQRPITWIMAFWVHDDSPHQQFVNYSQFQQQSVGYVRGYTYPKPFFEYKGFKIRHEVNNDLQGLTMLQGKRFEGFFGDIVNNMYLSNTHNLHIRPLAPAVDMAFLTLSFSDQKPDIHAQFETALNEMYNDGTVDALYRKYIGMTYQEILNKYAPQ